MHSFRDGKKGTTHNSALIKIRQRELLICDTERELGRREREQTNRGRKYKAFGTLFWQKKAHIYGQFVYQSLSGQACPGLGRQNKDEFSNGPAKRE